jgi:hypothetical protein
MKKLTFGRAYSREGNEGLALSGVYLARVSKKCFSNGLISHDSMLLL